MAKRKRNGSDEYSEESKLELKGIFVDTSLDTHLLLQVSPFISFSLFKEQIVMEHSKSFPDFGMIEIVALKVKRDKKYYNVSESVLLGTAFQGVEGWFVFADVAGTTHFNEKLKPTLISCKNVLKHVTPNNVSVREERELDIGSAEARKNKRKGNKKRKCEPTAVEAFASNSPAENAHKFENDNCRTTSLLGTKVLIPFSDGGAIEPNCLVGQKVELRKKGSRYDNFNVADHVHDASSVSADAVAKRSPELVGNMEGSVKISGRTLNQESQAHNAEAVCGSHTKKTKKTKKGGGDGIERSHAVTSGKLPEIMKDSVAAFDNEKVSLERESNDMNIEEEGTPLELTDGSKLLLSQREAANFVERAVVNEEDAAVGLVEREKVNEEDVTTLKSSGLKVTESEKSSSKKRKTSEQKSALKEKQDSSNIRENNHRESDGSYGAQPGQVPDVIQGRVTAIYGENLTSEKELDGKRIAGEDGMGPKNTPKKKKAHKTKTTVASKQDLSSLEMLQSADVSKPEQTTSRPRTRPASKLETQLQESSGVPSKELLNEKMMEMAAPKTVTDDCFRENKKKDPTDQSQVYHDELKDVPAVLVSANEAEETNMDKPKASKKKIKTSKQIERTSQFVTQVTNDNLVPAGTGKIDSELLQPAKSSKPEENIDFSSVKPKKRSRIKQTSSGIDAPETPVTEQVYHEELKDISASPVSANVVEETNMDVLKASKKKTKKSKQNESTSQDVAQTMNDNLVPAGTEQTGSELLQPASSSKPEENIDLSSAKPKKSSKNKPTFSAKDAIAPEIHVTVQPDAGPLSGNKRMKEMADPITVAGDPLRKNEKIDPCDQVYHKELKDIPASPMSANVAEETNVDKPEASKKKTKKSKQNEITSQAVTQNDNLVSAGTEQIDSELLQPEKSSKTEENTVQSQVYREVLNDIPASPVSAYLAEETNVDKLKASKKKTKKSQQTEITSEEALTQLVNDILVAAGTGQIDSDLLQPAKSSKPDEDIVQSLVCRDVLNDIPASPVSANVAEKTNVDKPKTSKKTKKSKQNEITSQAVTQNDNLVAGGTGQIDSELLQPARSNKSEENIDHNSVKPKKKSKSKQIPSSMDAPEIPLAEQVGNNHQKELGDSELEYLNETSTQKVVAHEVDMRNLEKQTTVKSKQKKLNQPSSVSTSSSLMVSKKSYESEKTSLVDHQLESDGHEAEQTNVIGGELIQPSKADHPEIHVEIPSDKLKTKSQKKHAAIKPKKTVADGLLTKSSIANGDHQHLNDISALKACSHEADMRNLEKQTTTKSKRKKLDQLSSLDTSSSLMPSKKDCESEKISLVGHQLGSDGCDDVMTISNVNNAEVEEKVLPYEKGQDGSTTPEADMRNLENQTTRKSKRKKLNQSSSVDTSSSLMTAKKGYESEKISLVGHQLPTDNSEVIEDVTSVKPKQRTQKKHSASEKSLRDLSMKQQPAIEPKAVEQAAAADDDQNQDKISLQEMHHSGSTEVKKLDNQPESTLKAGKLDLSSSVDTSSNEHNLIASKKSRKRERSGQVSGELQNDVQESELLSQSRAIPSIQVKKVKQKKPTVSVGGLSEEKQPDGLLLNGNGEAEEHENGLSPPVRHDNGPNEILSQDVSSAEKMKPEGPPASKQKNLDMSTSVDTKSKKENATVSNKKSGSRNGSFDGSHLSKSITARENGKKPQSSSNSLTTAKKVTGTKPNLGENSYVTKSGLPLPNMNHRKSSFISESAARRTHLGNELGDVQEKNSQEYVFKTPSNKIVGKPVKTLPPISGGGLFAGLSSDSSDNEVERNGLSDSTRTPDDSSSSDYSEGESKGDVVTSQGGGRATKKTDLKVPDLKDMDLPSILRSSSLYKKTRASQSQKEDDDSEPPDFVPESQFSS